MDTVKVLLGDTAPNYADDLINLYLEIAKAEVEAYCNRALDTELELVAARIAVIHLNRLNTEGLASQGYSGVSESYINDYPADIMKVLNRKRKVKVV